MPKPGSILFLDEKGTLTTRQSKPFSILVRFITAILIHGIYLTRPMTNGLIGDWATRLLNYGLYSPYGVYLGEMEDYPIPMPFGPRNPTEWR